MKRLFLLGVIALLAIAASGRAMAADAFGAWTNGLPTAWVEGPTCDPYVDFNCTPSKVVMALKSGVNAVHRVAVWRHGEYWDHAAEFGR
jgi:hypothetical protein